MKKFTFNELAPYTAVYSDGFDLLNAELINVFKGKKVLAVFDENTEILFCKDIINALQGYDLTTYTMPSDESAKSFFEIEKLIKFMTDNGFSRNDGLLAVGGGAISDAVGFTASIYMRGISYATVPTTLLSMVDASIGGKTGINAFDIKNAVGTFYFPKTVYVNFSTLSSLPEKEIKNGFGEIIKYAFITGDESLTDLNGNGIKDIIIKCAKIKSQIVEKDVYDNGVRRLLNFGHTVGHAIESLSGYTLSHGECVVKGINVAISVSEKLFGTDKKIIEKMKSMLKGYDLSLNFSADKIAEFIRHDKKTVGDTVNFIVPFDFGNLKAVDIKLIDLEKCLYEL